MYLTLTARIGKITIFVNLGLFRHFEAVTNIRTWIKYTDFGECCKMQIL